MSAEVDPDDDRCCPDRDAIVNAMRDARIPERFVYAFKKTGFILGRDGYENLTAHDRDEYGAALDEFDERRAAE